MSAQPMNLRRAFEILRRNKKAVGGVFALGLVVGAVIGSVDPPQMTSSALVVLPNTRVATQTMMVIATSDPVLTGARLNISPVPAGAVALRKQLSVSDPSPTVISINAQGPNAAAAESTANAVANSFVGYLGSAQSPVGLVNTRVLQPAVAASGPNPLVHRFVYGLVGALVGLALGMVLAIAKGRGDRRLRTRDDIANSVGLPVLASLPVSRPGSSQEWAKLLDSYEPGPLHAWRLRKTLQHLNVAGVNLTGQRDAAPSVVEVISQARDPRALAVGPQLAVTAAALGIPTALVVGPSQDENVTAALETCCASWQGTRSSLRTAVLDETGVGAPRGAALAVLVTVVDGADPRPDSTLRPAVTLLAVSAGSATAEQLALTAVRATARGGDITGLLVADPDPSDHSTGRLPQMPKPAPRTPTRTTGMATEARR